MKLHLVDGTFELFRAHYSKRPDRPQKATVGVVGSLLGLLHDRDEAPTHVAVAFDNPIRSFRNDLYDGYKSDEGVPPELREQFDAVEQGVRALGVVVWSMRDHEADDGLASGAALFRDQVDQVRILTPDKDLAQCLRGKNVVRVDRMRRKELDEETFVREVGIKPESVPDYLALTGDTSDGIPGVPGFGEKTAATLLGEYVHLENIPPDPRAWSAAVKAKVRGAERLAATLAEHHRAVMLWRKLATLVTDLPLAKTLDDVAFRGVPRDAFHAWCDVMNVNDLRDRPTRWG